MVMSTGVVKRKRHITNEKTSSDSTVRETIQELLPGIPDDITIAQILPKLSWAMLQKSAVVSRRWIQTLQSGRVYQARLSVNSTQTMFIQCVQETEAFQLSLYSVDDNTVYPLPTIPGFAPNTSSQFYTFASVNGRLYVFGDIRTPRRELFTYEYDLARHRGWRKRATPEFSTRPKDCAVLNDKIIVYDTTTSAVYDPDADLWFPIIYSPLENPPPDDMLSPIIYYIDGPHEKTLPHIGQIQEYLVNGRGTIFDIKQRIEWIPKLKFYLLDGKAFLSFCSGVHIKSAEHEVKSGRGIVVTLIHGRFFKLAQQHVEAYDNHTKTWTPLNLEGPFNITDVDLQGPLNLNDYDPRFHRPPMFGSPSAWAIDFAVARSKNKIYSVVERMAWNINRLRFESKIFLMESEIPVQGTKLQEDSLGQPKGACGSWNRLECSIRLCHKSLRCPLQL